MQKILKREEFAFKVSVRFSLKKLLQFRAIKAKLLVIL
jgi:hypothetical protein